jgi:hypothetical protein
MWLTYLLSLDRIHGMGKLCALIWHWVWDSIQGAVTSSFVSYIFVFLTHDAIMPQGHVQELKVTYDIVDKFLGYASLMAFMVTTVNMFFRAFRKAMDK